MSNVQCNWFNDITVEDDDVDPFAVHERGLPIEIGDEEARVSKALRDTLRKEGSFAEQGITCEIKDRPDTTCWACPVYKSDSNHPLSVLCKLGRVQDRLVTRLAQVQIDKKNEQAEEAA